MENPNNLHFEIYSKKFIILKKLKTKIKKI